AVPRSPKAFRCLDGQRGGHGGKLFAADRDEMGQSRRWPDTPFTVPNEITAEKPSVFCSYALDLLLAIGGRMNKDRKEIDSLRLLKAFAKIEDTTKRREIIDLVEAEVLKEREDADNRCGC
ncbi:hypothetical protein, partial [Bradyrhizobium sp.]|uniref:hypothetical protein n=1 Tax=Bradyrhizobium sp. TaxID=376 RepID=UPI003C3BF2E4